jgi:hypothetical protein
MSDDLIPLAGDESEPVYSRPEKVSSKYAAFETMHGDTAKLPELKDSPLLACAHMVLALRIYIDENYGTQLAEIEKASQFAADAKQKLNKALSYSAEHFPGAKACPMQYFLNQLQYFINQLQARAEEANPAQLRGISKGILEGLTRKLKVGDKELNPPTGANNNEKELKLSVVVGLIDEFVISNVAAMEACTAETFAKMGYKEANVDRAKDCLDRAATFDKL